MAKAEPNDRLEFCGCDWAPELGEHYRIGPVPGWTAESHAGGLTGADLQRARGFTH